MLRCISAFFLGFAFFSDVIHEVRSNEIKDIVKQHLVLAKQQLELTKKQLDLSKFHIFLLGAFLALPACKILWNCFGSNSKSQKELASFEALEEGALAGDLMPFEDLMQ